MTIERIQGLNLLTFSNNQKNENNLLKAGNIEIKFSKTTSVAPDNLLYNDMSLNIDYPVTEDNTDNPPIKNAVPPAVDVSFETYSWWKSFIGLSDFKPPKDEPTYALRPDMANKAEIINGATYHYDHEGCVSSIYYPDGTHKVFKRKQSNMPCIEYIYNKEGKITRAVQRSSSSGNVYLYYVDYEYDANGNNTMRVMYDKYTNTVKACKTFEYNDDGSLKREICRNNKGECTYFIDYYDYGLDKRSHSEAYYNNTGDLQVYSIIEDLNAYHRRDCFYDPNGKYLGFTTIDDWYEGEHFPNRQETRQNLLINNRNW